MAQKKISLLIFVDELTIDIDQVISSINAQSISCSDFEVLFVSSDYKKSILLENKNISFDARWIPVPSDFNCADVMSLATTSTKSDVVVYTHNAVILDSKLLETHLNYHLTKDSQAIALGVNLAEENSSILNKALCSYENSFQGYNYYSYGSVSLKKNYLNSDQVCSQRYRYLFALELSMRHFNLNQDLPILKEAKTKFKREISLDEIHHVHFSIGEEISNLVEEYPFHSARFIYKLDFRWPKDLEFISGQMPNVRQSIESFIPFSIYELKDRLIQVSQYQVNAYDCFLIQLEQYLKYCRIMGMTRSREISEDFPIRRKSTKKKNNVYICVDEIPDVDSASSRSFNAFLDLLQLNDYSVNIIHTLHDTSKVMNLVYLDSIGVSVYLDNNSSNNKHYSNQSLDYYKIFNEKPPCAFLNFAVSNKHYFETEIYKISKHFHIQTVSDIENISSDKVLSYLASVLSHKVESNEKRLVELSKFSFRKKISIIIPVYNKAEFTEKCLLTLYNTVRDLDLFEVIVVNNGSTDSTPELLAKYKSRYPNFFPLDFDMNLGFSRSINRGVERSCGEYLVLLNNDTELLENWLEELIEPLENDEEVGAVGAKLLYPSTQIQHAGVIFVRLCSADYPLAPYHIYRNLDDTNPLVNEAMIYPAVTGACIAIRRYDYDMVQGLDEGYWNGYEDVDLCFKLAERNLKVLYQPRSKLIHYEGQSGSERTNSENLNKQLFFRKWRNKVQANYLIDPNGVFMSISRDNIYPYSRILKKQSINF